MTGWLTIKDVLSEARLGAGAQLDPERVVYYAQTTDAIPPVVVYETPERRLLVDGHHRLAAARERGAAAIEADVRRGSRQGALEYAANKAARERGMSPHDAMAHIKRRSQGGWGAN